VERVHANRRPDIKERPLPTNIPRVYVDDSKNPGTLWIGSDHSAAIVEPLD